MATVRQTLSLQDKMSPVLSSVMRSMRSTMNVMQQLDAAAGRGITSQAWRQATADIDTAERALRDFQSQEDQIPAAQEKVRKGFAGWQAAIVTVNQALQLAGSLIQALDRPIQIADSFTASNARLNLINDGLQTQEQLQQKIFESAQRSRGAYQETVDAVAKLNLLAGNTFSSNDEAIAFAEVMNKSFAVSGADTAEASAAMRQMTQALASGRLQGDEFTSIRENAPLVAQAIQEYMGVSAAEMKKLSSEGAITADIIKAAVFGAADDINAKFEEMPMTFDQAMQSVQNSALFAFQPIMQMFSDFVNSDTFSAWSANAVTAIQWIVAKIQQVISWAQALAATPGFQAFAAGAVEAFSVIGGILLWIVELIGSIIEFIFTNWSTIEPILIGAAILIGGIATALTIYNGVMLITKGLQMIATIAAYAHAAATGTEVAATTAATAAQLGLNGALLACPLTWIILLIIALIAIIIAVAQYIANTAGVANSAFGVISGGVMVVVAFFKNLGLTVANIALGIGNALAAVGQNMMIAFGNAIKSVQSWFYGLLSTALTVVEGICSALNKLPFVEFDYSGISAKADEYAAKAAEAADSKEDYVSIGDAFDEGFSTFDTFQDGWASDAFEQGAAWGDGVMEDLNGMLDGLQVPETNIPENPGTTGSGFDPSQFSNGAGSFNTNSTGGKLDKVDEVGITDEDLRYLRDIAQAEYVNQYTTQRPVVYANFGDVHETADVNQVISVLEDAVAGAYDSSLDRG